MNPSSITRAMGTHHVRTGNTSGTAWRGVSDDISQASLSPIPQSELILPGLNPFFQWLSGKLKPKDRNNPTLFEKTNGYLLTVTKALWPLTLPFQLIGLVNDRFEKLSRAVYGIGWAIVYSIYRPLKNDRTRVTYNAKGPIPEAYKKFDTFNEHFRAIMGSLVSAVYGGGALGMLWAWLKKDDELYDKAAEVYRTGMFNQNQIFASMNAALVLRRNLLNKGLLDEKQLDKYDRVGNNLKAGIELVDTTLFIPNIIARGLDTFRLFGFRVGEGVQRFVDFLAKFSYGTWAARFGHVKTILTEKPGMGALDPINSRLGDKTKKLDEALHYTQKYSGSVFSVLLPVLSWVSACAELLGYKEFADKVFRLEGICERLIPTIPSWCRNVWLEQFQETE